MILFLISKGRLKGSVEAIASGSDPKTSCEVKSEPSSNGQIKDSTKVVETEFSKCGIVMNEDEISVDIASATGLRKTSFSEVLYEDNPIPAAKKAEESRIMKIPMLLRRKSFDNFNIMINNDPEAFKRISSYRSPQKLQQQIVSMPLKENTWSSIQTNYSKKRPPITSDTYKFPSRSTSLTRNTPLDQESTKIRQITKSRASASVNTSPNKTNTLQSPLAQQLLEAAGEARNDAQILGKVKQILNNYALKNNINVEVDDFTTTWVNNNGNLNRKNDEQHSEGESQLKPLSKISSTISSSMDSNPTISSIPVTSTRGIEKMMSRIPTPVRSNTGLY